MNKRYSHGLTITAAYTLSKNIQALNYLNPQDAEPARSLVPWDRTHRLVLAPIYELPFGPGKPFLQQERPVVGRIVGGWQLTMNTTLQGGNPDDRAGQRVPAPRSVIDNPTWDRMFNTALSMRTVSLCGTQLPECSRHSRSSRRSRCGQLHSISATCGISGDASTT